MDTRQFALIVGLTCWLSSLPAAAKEAPEADAPSAARVVVRGKAELADALDVACRPAWADPKKPRSVWIVIDVTPNTKKAAQKIRAALATLEARGRHAADWRIAPLGKKSVPRQKTLAKLSTYVDRVLKRETPVVSTFEALAANVRRVKGKKTVVVYLADWHFEDDCDVEGLHDKMRKKGVTFSVVGTEAAFGRGWNDGFKTHEEYLTRTRDPWYRDGVGRHPFGASTHEAPWHGGETAYPHLPFRWAWSHWEAQFNHYDYSFLYYAMVRHREVVEGRAASKQAIEALLDEVPEELAKEARALLDAAPPLPKGARLETEAPAEPEDPHRGSSLPSAFGPYGLMRLAGLTGGQYVLYGWGEGVGNPVKYDYARCNLFPPDLRSREDILSSLRKNRFAKAVLNAWHRLLEAGDDIVDVTPPLGMSGRTPRLLETISGGLGLTYIWDDEKEYETFKRAAPRAMLVVDHALEPLEEALADGAPPEAITDRRHHADALYLRYVLRKIRFELEEAFAATPDLPRKSWKKKDRPGVVGATWVKVGRDPHVILLESEHKPFNVAAGVRLILERKRLLDRLCGTPWGEEIALNKIKTYRPNWWEATDEREFRKRYGKSKSKGTKNEPPPSAPGGGSGGTSGPTTGK